MSSISPVDVLAAIGPISALILHEAVRTGVSFSELREALRMVKAGDADNPLVYDALECRMQRLVDLLSVACEPFQAPALPEKAAAPTNPRLPHAA